jgi:hypothetical protein
MAPRVATLTTGTGAPPTALSASLALNAAAARTPLRADPMLMSCGL